MHTNLATHHDAGIGFFAQTQRRPVGWVVTKAIANRRSASGKGEETTSCGQPVPILRRRCDTVRRGVAALHDVENTQRNQVAVSGCVGHVPGAEKERRGKRPPHPTQVIGTLRHEKRNGQAFPVGVGWHQQDVLPLRVEVTIVPGDIIIDHRAGRRMRRHVIDPTFTNNPDFASVTQAVAILSTRSNDCSLQNRNL